MPTPNTATMTPTQLHLYVALRDAGTWQGVPEIVATTGFSRHYVTRILGELRDQGVAVSRPDPDHVGRGGKPMQWRLA